MMMMTGIPQELLMMIRPYFRIGCLTRDIAAASVMLQLTFPQQGCAQMYV